MMKKSIAMALAVILCLSVVLCGCAKKFDKSPDQFEGIRWITYDYSFSINPADDCKGFYKFGDTKYNIQVKFESSRFTAVDTDKSEAELFNGDWTYEKDNSGKEQLYLYNIKFNKDDYEAFEKNYAEFVTLKQEEI